MLKEKFTRMVPKYTWIPLSLALALNCFVYFVLRLFLKDAVHYDLSLVIDSRVPFLPPFIIIYILAYFQWAAGYVIICREDPGTCYRVMSGEIISKLICAIFFIFLPTSMVRPEVNGTGIFDRLTALIYALDTPDNLFPSVHCMESWLVFRQALGLKKVPRAYKWSMLLLTLLVFASTLFVKQHLFVDIFGGVLVGEIGAAVSRLFPTGRPLEKLNDLIFGEAL